MATFQLITAQTLTGSQTSIVLGSGGTIPQTYTDLVIYFSARTDRTIYEADGTVIRFNGDTTSGNYSAKRLYGNGATASSDNAYGFPFNNGGNSTGSTFGNQTIYIPNYTGSTQKSFSTDGVSENNATTAFAGLGAGKWTGTAAITSITLTPEAGTNFVANTTIYLYGISKS
jgi:hypothetical protein